MVRRNRYDVSESIEARFEPGSRKQVLKNLLGIKKKREMDIAEQQEQDRALEDLYREYDRDNRFTADDVRRIHKTWLARIYPWAGEYRNVNLAKDNFTFASAQQIPRLMVEFEKGPLREFTPCQFESMDKVTRAISVVHTELVLIHPFREGNGRVARLLANLMASQHGLPPLAFGGIRGSKKLAYFRAIRAGMDRNYKPMEKVFSEVIEKTLKTYGNEISL